MWPVRREMATLPHSEESDGDPDKLLLFLVIFTQAVLDVHTTLILSGKDVYGQNYLPVDLRDSLSSLIV